jgi:hypothetical protein
MNCEFCNNVFSNLGSLNYHKNNTKYCLLLQGKTLKSTFKCIGCEKIFSRKFELSRHLEICNKNIEVKFKSELILQKESYEKLILKQKENYKKVIMKQKKEFSEVKDKYEKQIKELQDKLENIAIKAAERPTIQNNNNSRINQIINNLQPLKVDDFKEHTQHLTIDHIKNGASGYAKYALEYPLKDKIICVDYARRKIKYKDENGKLVNDPEMTKISQNFFTAIEDSNNELIKEYSKVVLEQLLSISEGNEEISEIEAEKCVEKSNNLLDEMMKVKGMKSDIENIKKGNKPELLHDFVKDVCLKTTC